jgi:hypothetical protein
MGLHGGSLIHSHGGDCRNCRQERGVEADIVIEYVGRKSGVRGKEGLLIQRAWRVDPGRRPRPVEIRLQGSTNYAPC